MPRPLLSQALRGAAYVAYYAVGTHLPRSYAPGGGPAARLRARAGQRLLDHAGPDVNIEHGATFGSGKGISLGARSGLGVDAEILGPVVIGEDVMMGPRCTIISANHRFDDVTVPMNRQGWSEVDRPVVIEDDVWIGANVTITARVRVGRGSILAAGSVVTRDVPPYSIAGGVPARVLRSRLPAGAGAAPPGPDVPGACRPQGGDA